MVTYEILITFTLILLEYCTILNILDCYLTKFIRKCTTNIILIILSSVIITIIIFLLNNDNLGKIVITLFSIVIIPNIHYIEHYKKKIILPLISLLAILVIDYIMLTIIVFLFNINITTIFENEVAFALSGCLSKLIALFISHIIKKYVKYEQNNENLKFIEVITLSCIPLTSILIIYTLIYLNIEENITNLWLMFLSLLIIISNVVFVVLTQKIENDRDIQFENKRLEELVKLEYQNIQSLAEEYENQRKLTHDFNNHLLVIQSLIKKDELNNLDDYINNLIGTNYLDYYISSRNVIIDAILNQKYKSAMELNIQMEVKVNDLSNIILKNKDMTIILANLIDNAIEASKLCNNKYIRIKIEQTEYELIVSIENSIIKELKPNNLLTTKRNSLEHGYGLKNVKSILKKYDAHLVTKSLDKCFKVSFIVNN